MALAWRGTGWEHFEHAADVGIRGYGPTRSAAFEQAALALTAVMAKPEALKPSVRITLVCEAPDDEVLLVDWLNALIYEMGVRRLLFGRFAVHMDEHWPTGSRLEAEAWGQPLESLVDRPTVEVKGATYTDLRMAREHHTWVAQCVVDV